MYHHLVGELVLLDSTRAVVDTGGVGYEVRIPLSTFLALKERVGQRVRLLTHLHVLEDDLRLYGFASERERDLFRLVTSVAGVGPTIGLAVLASFAPGGLAGFVEAVTAGDARALQRIRGVGQKLSERLVFELKDRSEDLEALLDGAPAKKGERRGGVSAEAEADAVAALVAIGFSRKEAARKVEAAIRRLSEAGSPKGGASGGVPTLEEIVGAALRARD